MNTKNYLLIIIYFNVIFQYKKKFFKLNKKEECNKEIHFVDNYPFILLN